MLRPLLRVDVTVIPYPCSSSGTSYGSLLAEALTAAVRAPTKSGPGVILASAPGRSPKGTRALKAVLLCRYDSESRVINGDPGFAAP